MNWKVKAYHKRRQYSESSESCSCITFNGLCNRNRVFSHDITAAILVSQNNETVAMLVSQTSPAGIKFFSYANAFFCSDEFA